MTIVVAHNRVMVADSMGVSDARRVPIGPKIIRLPDGGLVGCCGAGDDIHLFNEWAMRGFPQETPPKLSSGDEDGFCALHMLPDGSVRAFWSVERPHPMTCPAFIGEKTAVNFAASAIACGKTAGEAVALAIEHTIHVGGPVQIERLAERHFVATQAA